MEDFVNLMVTHKVPIHKLESLLAKQISAKGCVDIRRAYYLRELEKLDRETSQPDQAGDPKIPTENGGQDRSRILKQPHDVEFAYDRVIGACCENVVGCVRLPVGLAGPLILDNQSFNVPLATTEGCLVASTSRGMSALSKSGGVWSTLLGNNMTRAPVVTFRDPILKDAISNRNKAISWLQDPNNKETIRSVFQSSSRHTKLIDYTLHPIGRDIHIRFIARTGDAMGMNMCSKGSERALKEMQRIFPTMEIVALSGNMCTDKKPSAINWICGRGKSVECFASLPAEVVEKVLKVSVDSLKNVLDKKKTGSVLAGSIGGFNCHAANIVSAIFIATGQDVAQVVTSSNCLMSMEKDDKGALEVYCRMPSIECGTVGGGTILPDQSGFLEYLGVYGSSKTSCTIDEDLTGETNLPVRNCNACQLAKIICATVMAGELSLLASLAEGTLVKSHMTHNRSTQPCNVV